MQTLTGDAISGRPPLWYEQHGVGTIPEADRRWTPWTFAVIMMGTSYNLDSIVYGWLPISLGLGFTAAFTAIVAGTLAGMILVIPLILIGARTATNNATASGAEFGIYGRVIGSGLGQALMLVGAAVGVWASGGVLVDVAARLWHTPTGNWALAAAYAILTLLSVAIAMFGFHALRRASWVMTFGGILFIALMVVAFGGHLHPGYRGAGYYALGTFRATWLLAALAAGTGSVVGQCTQFGDWTRYISARRYPASKLLPPALLAIAAGYIVPLTIGALVTTAFRQPAALLPQALASAAPGWYAAILVPGALLLGLGWSASTIYSAGLDLDALIPGPRRMIATAAASIAAIALILTGLAWNASSALSTLSVLLLAVTAPWAAVVGAGYVARRGSYEVSDLQVWNERRQGEGTAYWYRRGWNWPAVTAWAAGSAWGLLTVQTTLYKGPLASVGGGVAGAFIIAALVYGLLGLLPAAARTRRVHAGPLAGDAGIEPAACGVHGRAPGVLRPAGDNRTAAGPVLEALPEKASAPAHGRILDQVPRCRSSRAAALCEGAGRTLPRLRAHAGPRCAYDPGPAGSPAPSAWAIQASASAGLPHCATIAPVSRSTTWRPEPRTGLEA